ncbi:MAG: DUF2804 domain-containing protein [Desulfobacter sp.]|nr:MAG: DUF2804 domain-containing protein [Desulfobacter sp.]
MKQQVEITEPCPLLTPDGTLTREGYATRPFWQYDRNKIKAPWHRIKEWDYYCILSHELGYGITLTVADLSYIGLVAVCWLDFRKRTFVQEESLMLLPRGKTNLPYSSQSGMTVFRNNQFSLVFDVDYKVRHLRFEVPGFVSADNKKGLEGRIELAQDPKMDSMVIATSWEENRNAFYYNQKTNCMPAKGEVIIGGQSHPFQPENSFGVLDWGRGHWTYKNRWFWGSASGLLDGHPIGWNLGYGFSDRSTATENMIFYKGRAHKLDGITFCFDTGNYMSPWRFGSVDNRFKMRMEPLIDRHSSVNLGLIKSVQHQVFGTFSGNLILDDGTELKIENMLGFAEDVLNWW